MKKGSRNSIKNRIEIFATMRMKWEMYEMIVARKKNVYRKTFFQLKIIREQRSLSLVNVFIYNDEKKHTEWLSFYSNETRAHSMRMAQKS
jgi:hypothetical protein